jgi:hypothetical protein
VHIDTSQPASVLLEALSRAGIIEVTVIAIAAVIVTGVVLPAVWSAKPARRAAARAVLELLLRLARGNYR